MVQMRAAIECRDTVADNAIMLPTAGADLRVADFDERRDRVAAEQGTRHPGTDAAGEADDPDAARVVPHR